MHEPVTTAGLPRNREADAWREDARMWTRVAFASWYVALGLLIALSFTEQERDAARAQVAAAEQRAERAEARNAENTCGHQYDVGRIRKQVCVGVATGFQWWSVSESAPPRVIYDEPSTQWNAGAVTVPWTLEAWPACTSGVPGALCVYDGDRGQP